MNNSNSQLITYISDLLKQGYTLEQIRLSLISSGWPENQINEAIYQINLNKQNISSSIQQNQPNYPQTNQSLIQNKFSQKPYHIIHSIHIPTKILVVFSLIIFLISIMFFIYSINKEPRLSTNPLTPMQLLDFDLNIVTKEVPENGVLETITKLTNMGIEPRFDVEILFKIKKDDKIFYSWETTKAVMAVQEYAITRDLPPSLKTGTYTLEAEATYDSGSKKAKSSAMFTVIAKESCSDNIKNQGEESIDCGGPCPPCPTCNDKLKNQGEESIDCGGPCKPCIEENNSSTINKTNKETNKSECGGCDDKNICTSDLCEEGNCTHKKIDPCCGDGKCSRTEDTSSCSKDCTPLTSFEIKEQVIELAKEDVNTAGEYCVEIVEKSLRDYCFLTLAHQTYNKNFCEYIEGNADYCYIKFASSGDITVCTKIKNINLQKACKTLGSK